MNKVIVEDNWKKVRDQVRDWWGDITDDDLDEINGRLDRLADILQERYGYTREHAEDSISEFLYWVEEGWKEHIPDSRR